MFDLTRVWNQTLTIFQTGIQTSTLDLQFLFDGFTAKQLVNWLFQPELGNGKKIIFGYVESILSSQ